MFDNETTADRAIDPINSDFPDVYDPEEEEAKRADRLQLFTEVLCKRRNEAVQARAASGTERRWLDDIDAYQGRDAATRRVDLLDTVSGQQIAQRRSSNDSTRPAALDGVRSVDAAEDECVRGTRSRHAVSHGRQELGHQADAGSRS
jgi:hypothetical protein